jgi:hypothetical protein
VKGVDNSRSVDARDMIETGFAVPGSPLHRWMKTQARGVSDTVGFQYSIHASSSAVAPLSFLAEVSKAPSNTKGITLDADPGPPSGTPNGIPSSATTNDSCALMRVGNSPATGNVTFTWSYQYTRASTSGGPKDSDPQWVLTAFSASNVQFVTESSPIGC